MHYETNPNLVRNNDTYIAIKNDMFNGYDYIDLAIKNGAKRIVGEERIHNYKHYKKVKNSYNYLLKMINKDTRIISNSFKIIAIISSVNEEKNILFQLIKKFNKNCAYLTKNVLFYKKRKEYFNDKYFDTIQLNKILHNLYQENIEYLIINFSPEQIGIFSNINIDYTIINNLNLITKQLFHFFKKTNKNIIYNLDELDIKFYKSKLISYGKKGDYQITEIETKQKNSNIRFEHQYNKYNVSINTTNKILLNNYISSLVALNLIGFDLLDILDVIKKDKHQKRTK